MTVEAHEGAIIAIRSYGWGKVKKIKPHELYGGFTYEEDMMIKLELENNPPDW